jgi:hypothetical protein
LHPAAHDAKRFPRLAILHHETGNDGVKRSFPRRVNIRVSRIHREKFATILKHESETRHDNATAHPAVVALNERNHVALIIGGAHVNRVPLIERRISWIDMFVRAIGIDQLAAFCRVFF